MKNWIGRKFSRQLTLALCLMSGATVIGAWLLLGNYFQRSLVSELTDRLFSTCEVIESQLDKSFFKKPISLDFQNQAKLLSKSSGARISFISINGKVLADSSVDFGELGGVENHSDRPEVHAALEGERGKGIRRSHTTGRRFKYVAVPALSDNQIVGVVRAAYPLLDIETKDSLVRRQTALMAVVILLISTIIAILFSHSLSQPIQEMSLVARKLADGNYEARVRYEGNDEHGRLARTLNLLASQVQLKIQELTHDKAHLSAILSNMTEGVVVVGSSGRIVDINPALAKEFGVNTKEVQGKEFLEVLRHHQLDQLIRVVLSEKRPQSEEIRTFVPEEKIFEAQAVPLFEEDHFSGALMVLHDITKIRKLEQIRRDFVANVSHELRTPLASIKGFAETLEMGALSDPKNAKAFVNSIQKQADRMTALIEDLLELTAIESGKRVPFIETVPIYEIIDEVTGGLRPLAKKRNLEIQLNVSKELPAVLGDRNQLRQVFVNLMENAIKFTQQGSVVLSAQVEGARLRVDISDTGIGIPQEDLTRIFERFYRVDKARSREMGGTGLGLSIVKHIVESLGGSITVSSVLSKGTVFSLYLPIQPYH